MRSRGSKGGTSTYPCRFEDGLCGFCGGTIVASKYVITAAHCMWEKDWTSKKNTHEKTPDQIAVRIGEHNRKREGEEILPAEFVHVKAIHKHPNFFQERDGFHDKPTYGYLLGYDIAILELERELDLTKFTPVCLPKKSDLYRFDGKSARAVGWAPHKHWTVSNGNGLFGPFICRLFPNVCLWPETPKPTVPYEVDLTVVPHTDTRCDFEDGTRLPQDTLCSGMHELGMLGACQVSLKSSQIVGTSNLGLFLYQLGQILTCCSQNIRQ